MNGFSGSLRSNALLALALIASGFGMARAQDQSPIPPPLPPNGDVLKIPGFPPVQMPPGARVFGPDGRVDGAPPAAAKPDQQRPVQSAAPAAPAPDTTAAGLKPDMSQAAGRKKILDDLFERLGKSQDDRESRVLITAIERVWMYSGSDTADLLMSRATEAVKTKDWSLSEEVFEKIVAILPGWAEGWNKRATARFAAEDFAGAIEDVAHVLAIEPRHFGALSGLGFMFQKMDMNKQALQAFRKALDVNPRQAELRKLVEKLALEVDGRDI